MSGMVNGATFCPSDIYFHANTFLRTNSIENNVYH